MKSKNVNTTFVHTACFPVMEIRKPCTNMAQTFSVYGKIYNDPNLQEGAFVLNKRMSF